MKDPNQPEPPGVAVKFSGDGKALYSQMPIDDLMKLHKYIGELIDWIKAGNPIYLGSFFVTIAEKTDGETTPPEKLNDMENG